MVLQSEDDVGMEYLRGDGSKGGEVLMIVRLFGDR